MGISGGRLLKFRMLHGWISVNFWLKHSHFSLFFHMFYHLKFSTSGVYSGDGPCIGLKGGIRIQPWTTVLDQQTQGKPDTESPTHT